MDILKILFSVRVLVYRAHWGLWPLYKSTFYLGNYSPSGESFRCHVGLHSQPSAALVH